MSLDSNRALAVAFFLSQDERKGGPEPTLCSNDYVARIGAEPPMNAWAHDAYTRPLYEGAPDAHHDIHRVVVEGDQAVVHFSVRGTHTQSMWGIEATGATIDFETIALLEIRDGLVASLRALYDQGALMQQLGLTD